MRCYISETRSLAMGDQYQVLTAPLVNVRVTSNLNSFTSNKRYDRSLTIGDLKVSMEVFSRATHNTVQTQASTPADVTLSL